MTHVRGNSATSNRTQRPFAIEAAPFPIRSNHSPARSRLSHLRASRMERSKCESGDRRVDVIELKAFARLYGKPLDYFVR